jgi:hypothetical protein
LAQAAGAYVKSAHQMLGSASPVDAHTDALLSMSTSAMACTAAGLTWSAGSDPARKELRPVITRGARAINELFDGDAKR